MGQIYLLSGQSPFSLTLGQLRFPSVPARFHLSPTLQLAQLAAAATYVADRWDPPASTTLCFIPKDSVSRTLLSPSPPWTPPPRLAIKARPDPRICTLVTCHLEALAYCLGLCVEVVESELQVEASSATFVLEFPRRR